jgi:hypothetical protein
LFPAALMTALALTENTPVVATPDRDEGKEW